MTVEDLSEMFMYEFRAKAVNALGTSDPSITMTVVIQDDEGILIHSVCKRIIAVFLCVSYFCVLLYSFC